MSTVTSQIQAPFLMHRPSSLPAIQTKALAHPISLAGSGLEKAFARGQNSRPPSLQLSSPAHAAVSTSQPSKTHSPQPPTLVRPSTGGAHDRPEDPPSRYRSMVENQATAKAVQCVNSQAEIKKNDELVFVASLINHCQSITDRRTPLAPFSLLAQPALGILRLKQSPAKRPVPNRTP